MFGDNTKNARTTIEYSIYIDKVFSEKFCDEYVTLQDQLSDGTIEYVKHAPY